MARCKMYPNGKKDNGHGFEDKQNLAIISEL